MGYRWHHIVFIVWQTIGSDEIVKLFVLFPLLVVVVIVPHYPRTVTAFRRLADLDKLDLLARKPNTGPSRNTKRQVRHRVQTRSADRIAFAPSLKSDR